MFKMPHRFFLMVTIVYSLIFSGVVVDAQVALYQTYSMNPYPQMKEMYDKGELKEADPALIRLIEKATRELNGNKMLEFELAGSENLSIGTNYRPQILDEFDRSLAKIDPELYLSVRERGIPLLLRANAEAKRDFTYLLHYNHQDVRQQLKITELQFSKIEPLIDQLRDDFESERSILVYKLKEHVRSYYREVQDCLSADQRLKHDNYYGEPLVLSKNYHISVPAPGEFLKNYDLFFHADEFSDLHRKLQQRLEMAFDPNKRFDEEEDIINQYTGTEIDWTQLRILGTKLIDIDDQKLADIREVVDAGKEIKFADFWGAYEQHRLRLMFQEKLVFAEALQKILSKKQLQRLAQLEFQLRDSNILDLGLFSEAVAELKLSEKQVEEIRQKQAEVLESIGKEYEKYQTAMEAPLTEAYERCEKVLDEKQLAAVTLKMDRKEFITRLVGKKIEAPAKQKATDEK